MMGKQDNQMQMMIFDIESMIPENHLLRQIKKDLLTNSYIFNHKFYYPVMTHLLASKKDDSCCFYCFYHPFKVKCSSGKQAFLGRPMDTPLPYAF